MSFQPLGMSHVLLFSFSAIRVCHRIPDLGWERRVGLLSWDSWSLKDKPHLTGRVIPSITVPELMGTPCCKHIKMLSKNNNNNNKTKQRWRMLKESCGIPVAEIKREPKHLPVSCCSKDLRNHQQCTVSGDLPLTRLKHVPVGLWQWQRPWRKAESWKGKVLEKLGSVLEL